jgi:tetratricopeptide (TPR) repeat protein
MHQQAISHFKTLLDIYPNNPLARFHLGMARLANQEPEKALDVWAPMLDLENEFMANFHSAQVLIQLGRSEEALPMVERANKNMPDDHPLYSKLQEIRAQLDKRPNVNLN